MAIAAWSGWTSEQKHVVAARFLGWSVNATLQALIAAHFGGNYGIALAAVAGTVAIVIAVLTAVGTEAKGVVFAKAKVAVA